jgi:hypothetical protein
MGFERVVCVFLFFFGLISGAIEFADQLKRTVVHDATQAVRPTLSVTHGQAPKSQQNNPLTPLPINATRSFPTVARDVIVES